MWRGWDSRCWIKSATWWRFESTKDTKEGPKDTKKSFTIFVFFRFLFVPFVDHTFGRTIVCWAWYLPFLSA
jgi:hypothetical protein